MTRKPSPVPSTENSEENTVTVKDIRMMRPVIFYDKKTKRGIVVQPSEFFKLEGCSLSFFKPNNVSLFVSISHREILAARKIYESLISKRLAAKKKIEIKGRNLTRLYNYLEHIQSGIIAIYTALESFANVAIPPDYKVEKKNQKGVTEVWDKAAIERWYKTSDKIAEVIPSVLGVGSPKTLKVWSTFRELEDIRNEIIHQKTVLNKPQDVDSSFIRRLLHPRIFTTVQSGFVIISYFCSKDTAHTFFPMGFGPALVKAEEVDDVSTVLKKIDDDV